MPGTTVNGRNFENETEARLYQEALDMVNGNESEIHEDTLRSVVSRHNNEDVLREASNLAHTFGFTTYEAELNDQYRLVRDLEAASFNGDSEVLKTLLNDRDQTKNLSHDEHITRYENALTRAGFTSDQIKSILDEYRALNPNLGGAKPETTTKEPEQEKENEEQSVAVVKDEDQSKKKVGVSEENVVRLSKKGALGLVKDIETLAKTIEFSNRNMKKSKIWKDRSQLDVSKSNQAGWEKELAELEEKAKGLSSNSYFAEREQRGIDRIKKALEKNKIILDKVEVRDFGKQPDGSYKGGRIELKNENSLGIKGIKLSFQEFAYGIKKWYLENIKKQKETQDSATINEATEKSNEIEREGANIATQIAQVNRCCAEIQIKGIKRHDIPLDDMQRYYEKATNLLPSINGCSSDVKALLSARIENSNKRYQETKEEYEKYIQENIVTIETELNRLHNSISDDEEHDIQKEQDMLKLVQKLYPTCQLAMDDQQKEKMDASIKQAEAELKNKAIYLKYKDLFERTKGLARLNAEMATTKLDSLLNNLQNEEFAEAIKYNKNDLIALFVNEKNQLLNPQPEKKEEQTQPQQQEEKIEPEKVITVEPEEEVEVKPTAQEQTKPEMVTKVEKTNPTPEFVFDKQVKTIFARQKQQIDEQAQKIQEQAQKIQEQNEIIANLQKQLAEAKAQETLQTQKKEAENNMMSTIADIKKEARELGTQKTHLEWEINSLKSGISYLDEIENMPMVQNELSKITDKKEKIERLHQLAEGYAEKKNQSLIEQKEKELAEVADKLQELDNQINQFSDKYQTMVSDVDEIKKKAEEERQQKIDDFGNDLKSFEQQKRDEQKQALENARVNIDDLFASMEENEKGKSL